MSKKNMKKLVNKHRISVKDQIAGGIYGAWVGLGGYLSSTIESPEMRWLFSRLFAIALALTVVSLIPLIAPVTVPAAIFMMVMSVVIPTAFILTAAIVGLWSGLRKGLSEGYTKLYKNDGDLRYPFDDARDNQYENNVRPLEKQKEHSTTKKNAHLQRLVAAQQVSHTKQNTIEMTPHVLTQGAHRPTTTTTSGVSIFSDKNPVKPISDSDNRPSYRLTQKA